MLNITMRPCQLGSSINTRTEKHGDEDVPACDIPLDGIMLSREELDALLTPHTQPGASQSLFHRQLPGGHLEPALPMVQALVLRDKLDGATVELQLNGKTDEPGLMVYAAKIKQLTLEPMSGGATRCALKLQCSGDDVPELVGALLAHLNGHISVDIADAKTVEAKGAKQQPLPINALAEDDAGELDS